MFEWLRSRIDDLVARAEEHGRQGLAQLLRMLDAAVETARQLSSQRALQIAASLSFTTILSVVPLLAVSFAVLRTFVTSDELGLKVQNWLLSTLLADSVTEVTTVLMDFLARADGGALGAVGTVFLLVTALSLFMSIESSFNSIWRVPLSRPLHRRLTTFYAVITLTPALLGVGVWFAAKAQATLDSYSFGLSVGAGVMSFAMTVLGLTLMYKLLPHTAVRWRVAIAGALGAAIALQITRAGFNYYIGSIYQGGVQSKIYGTFSLVPVFFLWVYLTWIIVLGGNILAYTVQHRDTLTRAVMRRRRRAGQPAPPNGYLICRVFLIIARHFRDNGGGISPEKIAARLQIEANEVNPALQILRHAELVLLVSGRQTVLVPGRPLHTITLADLYRITETDGYQPGQLPGGRFGGLEWQLAAAERARYDLLGLSIAQVLDNGDAGIDEETAARAMSTVVGIDEAQAAARAEAAAEVAARAEEDSADEGAASGIGSDSTEADSAAADTTDGEPSAEEPARAAR